MRAARLLPLTVLFLSVSFANATNALAQGAPAPKAAPEAPKPATPAPKAADPAKPAAPATPAPKPATPAPKAADPAKPATPATPAPKPATAAPKAADPAKPATPATPAPKPATAAPKAADPAKPATPATPAPKATPEPPKENPEAQSPKEKAEALLVAGRKLLEAHEPDKAVPLLEEAYGILQDPESGFELMSAYAGSGKLVESMNLGEKLMALPLTPQESGKNLEARKNIKEATTVLAERISTLQLQIVRPAKDLVRVKVDERTLLPEQLDKPIRVNAGKRSILVTAPGYEPLTIPQVVEDGPAKQYPVKIEMTPVPKPTDPIVQPIIPEEPPSAPLSPMVKSGISVAGGLGVVAIATGIAAGVTYVGFVDVYNRRGCGDNCEIEVNKRGATLQALTLTSVISGGAAIALGTMTLVYARKEQKTDTTAWHVSPTPGGFVVHGRW